MYCRGTNSKKNDKKNEPELRGTSKKKFGEAVRRLWKYLLDLLFPPHCVLCDQLLGRSERFCCRECEKKLPWVRQPACMKCGKPVAGQEQEYCDDCRKYKHYFVRGAAAFTYTGGIRHSVYRMKKQNRREYLDFYAEAMVQALMPHLRFWEPEILLPVPMYWIKRRQRGYNQAELLAEKISMLTGIPTDRHILRCIRRHEAQKLLGRKERLQNLRGTFEAVNLPEDVKSVLLIDDVYTTGSTVDELSRVLKNAGVQQIYFLVLCTGKGKKTVCRAENL